MEPLYKPEGVEARWQQTWEAEGLYNADVDPARRPYTIAFPPPNVTGELHMGHALNASIQDALIRWHRMRGFNALWQPGYDHAGIATQNVVERELAKEGLTRDDLGREAFLQRVWAWLEKYGGVIMGQLRSMGASLDYRRERMTMDEGYVRAVMRFFAHLYEKDLVYRANRIVNWCPRDASAISDLEVNHIAGRRHALVDPLSARRRLGARDDRDRPPRDDARGHRRRGEPERRALRAADRQGGDRADRRTARADHRRRARRDWTSAPARSRSRPATTRRTSRSAATTASRRSP